MLLIFNLHILGNLCVLGSGKITIGSHTTIRANSEAQSIDRVSI